MTEETKGMEVAKKEPINISLANGIKPKDYAEMMQFAALYAKSGLAPKSFDNDPAKLAIAIAMCLEVGRPIITGLSDMAVINGKVSVYGDAALAMVRASGLLESIEETEEGPAYHDGWTFYCKLKRRGEKERVGVWSWEDVRRAGLDKAQPPSPWARFTRRMMTFKARNFVLRDAFGDVLRGMRLVEDAQDIIEMEPTSSGYQVEEPVSGKVEALKNLVSNTSVTDEIIQDGIDPVLQKEYWHLRKGEKGTGGLMLYITENADRIANFPEGNFNQLKEKFTAMYGVEKWPKSLTRSIVNEKVTIENEVKEEAPPWEEETPNEPDFIPPDCCKPCSMEKCNAQFDLYFANKKGDIVCLHSPTYKPEEFKIDEPAPKQEVKEEKQNGNTSVVCKMAPGQPRKLVSFCAKCINAETCGQYKAYLKEHGGN